MTELNWYDASLHTLLVLTTIGQCYVIWIVVKKSPKSMSEYRYFLCLCTVGFNRIKQTLILDTFRSGTWYSR